jgi:uncharacterized protein (TIGR03437 family)
MFRVRLSLALIAVSSAMHAQPAIYSRGVVNAANFAPVGLPNGSIAQGSLFSIFGASLGPAQGVTAGSFPLQTTLGNVSITVGQGAAAVKAIPYFVSAGLVNAIMPSNAPLGLQPVYVTYNSVQSNASPVTIVATSFSFFSFNGIGTGPAAAANLGGAQAYNSPTVTAKPGQPVVIYGTGLGPIPTPDTQPAPGNSPTIPVQVFVGGIPAQVLYSGRAPGSAGEDQINFNIPPNAPAGCWVPVYAVANGITSNAVTLAIDANGAACSDAANPLAQPFVSGKTLGTVMLMHSDMLQDDAVENAVDLQTDLLFADFASTPAAAYPFAPLFSLPPPGACTLIEEANDPLGVYTTPATSPETPLPVAKNFTIASGGKSKQVAPLASSGNTAFYLGSAAPAIASLPNESYLTAGSYTVSAPANGSVGAIQAAINMPAPFTWTNRTNLFTVPRSQALTLNWSGVPANQYVAIFGGDVDLPTNSAAMFYCLAPAGATSFTIPQQILAAIPPSRTFARQFKAAIYLWTTPTGNGTPFSVQGIDSAYAIGANLLGKTVVFQ